MEKEGDEGDPSASPRTPHWPGWSWLGPQEGIDPGEGWSMLHLE